MFQMLGVFAEFERGIIRERVNAGLFAEFETNLRRERQMEGIAKAKAAGVYKGRPASIDVARVQQLKADGMGPAKIAKALGIGRASVYRAMDKQPPGKA